MLKVGIYGGTFDPIHRGHLITANDILENCGMDKVVFMPAGNPPHKSGKKVTEAKHRVNMIKAAIDGNDKLDISLIEAEREGTTYTVDTLRVLVKENNDIRYYFIIGSDVVLDILSWKKIDEVFKLCGFLVMLREGYDDEKVLRKVADLREKYNAEIIIANVRRVEVSSTSVKRLLLSKERFCELEKHVPSGTLQYICQNNLYTKQVERDRLSSVQVNIQQRAFELFDSNSDLKLDDIYERLRGFLSEKRLIHSLGTMIMAGKLAERYADGDNILYKKALLAGLLHDCAKQVVLDEEEMIARCKQYGVSEADCGKYTSALMHAVLGEIYAKEVFGVEDVDILSAIRYHTTGRVEMTLLEKIIYVSDSIEETRSYPGVEKYRKLAFENIDKCVFKLADNTILRIKKTGGYLHPKTVEVFDYYTRDY